MVHFITFGDLQSSMRGVSATSSGVSDIPMRLMIAAVITSIAIPAFWSAYDDLSSNITIKDVESDLRAVLRSIDKVMSGGVGSTLEVDMEIDAWGSSNIEEILIGGSLRNGSDPSRYMITYEIRGRGRSILTLDPPVAMGDLENEEGVRLGEGRTVIRLVHGLIEKEHVCLLQLV